ncbi:ferredoxin--NADP reductase [Mangrovimonas cancribranchiae]|uniref:Ferredoxin--NADP reductase n=1 Tax=Mangrovimonas cancribranchiae TaxID=3080055 RepID=A0AAU6NVT5_9FLAO
MATFHKLTIKHIIRETSKAVSIAFEVPDELKSEFLFKAGQYITLKTTLNGEEIRRDYSICSTPQSGDLKVAVKAVENGTFSQYANTQLQEGDTLDVAPPNGRFTFEPDTSANRTIMAFAAGSGITPVIGIIKTLLTEEPNSKAVLVYGNKTPEEAIFLQELIALQSQYSDRFSLQLVFSQTQEDDALFGRIEKSSINFSIKRHIKDADVDAYYLCGPEGMITTVSDVLTESGIAKDKIKFELFQASTPEPSNGTDISEGQTQVTVILDDEETTFVMDNKKSVLEAALAEDLDAPYSCQGGICSSCLARLKEGEVDMRQNNILTDNEVAEGLVLTCQSHPKTPKIIVDYDDI